MATPITQTFAETPITCICKDMRLQSARGIRMSVLEKQRYGHEENVKLWLRTQHYFILRDAILKVKP